MDLFHPLGIELLACRNRTRLEFSSLIGLNYWGATAFNAIVYSFIAAAIIAYLADIPPPQLYHPAFYMSYLVAAAAIVWASVYFGRRPPRAVLWAHELGIRYRKRNIRYDELESLFIGFDPRHWMAKITRLSEIMAQIPIKRGISQGSATMMRRTRQGSLTLVLHGGETVLLKSIYLLVVEEDLDKFFTILDAKRPGLLEVDEADEANAADLDEGSGEVSDFDDEPRGTEGR